jgi:hypothetical protein
LAENLSKPVVAAAIEKSRAKRAERAADRRIGHDASGSIEA